MKFALVLIIMFPNGTIEEVPWAETHDERACAIAGAGSAAIMAEAHPGFAIGYRCDPLDPEATS
jgi:hypothetical protein